MVYGFPCEKCTRLYGRRDTKSMIIHFRCHSLVVSTYLWKRHDPTGLVQAPSFFSAVGMNPKAKTGLLSS